MKKKQLSTGKMLLIEAVCIFIMLMIMLSWGGEIAYFIDAPSLLLLMLLSLPLLLASGMTKDFLRAFSIGKKEYSLLQMKRSLEAVNMVKKLILCSTGFTVVVDFIRIMHTMMSVEKLGPNVAVMVLTVFYGLLFEFFLIPLSTLVQTHILEVMNIEEEYVYEEEYDGETEEESDN